jgi:hypothetical protein
VKLPNNNFKLLVEVEQRVELSFNKEGDYPIANYNLLPDEPITELEDLEILISDAIEKIQMNILK